MIGTQLRVPLHPLGTVMQACIVVRGVSRGPWKGPLDMERHCISSIWCMNWPVIIMRGAPPPFLHWNQNFLPKWFVDYIFSLMLGINVIVNQQLSKAIFGIHNCLLSRGPQSLPHAAPEASAGQRVMAGRGGDESRRRQTLPWRRQTLPWRRVATFSSENICHFPS